MSTNTSEEELQNFVYRFVPHDAYCDVTVRCTCLADHRREEILKAVKDYQLKDRAERDKFVLESDGMVGTDNLPDPYNISPEIQRVVKERIVRRAKQWDNTSNTTNKEEL